MRIKYSLIELVYRELVCVEIVGNVSHQAIVGIDHV